MPNRDPDRVFDYEVHREGPKNAKILYINFVLRALRVFAVHNQGVRTDGLTPVGGLCYAESARTSRPMSARP
jgi:hypothetical protein